ncbi:MAG: GGDEF domain-containing protein [Desulfobacterium sp.]|nr:GGDEF domain-containing protein [Desulfobacterium sp.]
MYQSFYTEIIEQETDIPGLERLCLNLNTRAPHVYLFPKPIESYFSRSFFNTHKRQNLIFMIIGLLVYDLFAIMDKQMLLDIYPLAWQLRFLGFTPVTLALLYLIHKTANPRIMDRLIISILTLGSILILTLLCMSGHPLSAHYHSGVFVVSLAGLLIFKISIRYKALFALVTMGLHLVWFPFITTIPIESKFNTIAVLVALCFVCLISAFEREGTLRKAFIYGLSKELSAHTLEKKARLLELLSNRDELTGLANRRFLNDHLNRLVTQTENSAFPISILYVDIDDFKRYNDTYGHSAGDLCLQKVSTVFKGYANRRFDLASRCGGEEFVMVLPFTGTNEAMAVAEKIRTAVETLNIPHRTSGVSDRVTISTGIATITITNRVPPSEALNQADQALYRAKRSGKNKVTT